MNSLKRIAVITPGYKPVPDVLGGAVEHLITHIILQNEVAPHFVFDVFTLYDEKLEAFDLKYTNLIFIKNWRANIFKRAISYLINFFPKKIESNYRFNFFAKETAEKISSDTGVIIMENDLDILRALKPRVKSLPIIFHMHNDFDTLNEKQKTTDSLRWTVKNVKEIWGVSEYIKNHLLSVFPNSNVKTLYNSIDRQRFVPASVNKEKMQSFKTRYNICDEDFVILYSGRIIPQKGVLELIHACMYLPQNMNFKLLIAGDLKSSPQKYRKLVESEALKLGAKVCFTGLISHYEIQTAYTVSDIVAIPSQCQEAFCLTALEASSNCKPCVASISGGMTEVLDNSCAEMVELGSGYEKRLSDAIYKLYCDEHLRLEMCKNAGNKSKNFPDEKEYFEKFTKLMEQFYDQIS